MSSAPIKNKQTLAAYQWRNVESRCRNTKSLFDLNTVTDPVNVRQPQSASCFFSGVRPPVRWWAIPLEFAGKENATGFDTGSATMWPFAKRSTFWCINSEQWGVEAKCTSPWFMVISSKRQPVFRKRIFCHREDFEKQFFNSSERFLQFWNIIKLYEPKTKAILVFVQYNFLIILLGVDNVT